MTHARSAAWAPMIIATLLPSLVGASDDLEQSTPFISDRFAISAGGFLADFTTDARIGVGGLIGTLIRLEDDLGVQRDESAFRADGVYRFRPKHSLDFGVFVFDRSGTQLLSDEISFQDLVFDIGALVSTRFQTQLYKATYRYAFVNDGRNEAGLAAGVSTYRFKLGLAGLVEIDDGSGGVRSAFREGTEAVLAPIPTFGLFLEHAFSPRLILRSSASFFRISLSDFRGRLVDTRIGVEYFFWKWLGAGLGANSISVGVEGKGDEQFLVTYAQTGLLFHLTAAY